MRRRDCLAAVAAVVGGSRCVMTADTGPGSGEGDDDPGPTITAPTVAPGESATLTIEAGGVINLYFSETPDADLVAMGDAEFSPEPKTVYLSDPPSWIWPSPTDISAETPVRAPETADPGSYQYEATFQRGENGAEATKSFTITVEG